MFSKLVKLERLGIYDNQITSLPEQVFSKLVELRKLGIGGNPLVCCASLPAMNHAYIGEIILILGRHAHFAEHAYIGEILLICL